MFAEQAWPKRSLLSYGAIIGAELRDLLDRRIRNLTLSAQEQRSLSRRLTLLGTAQGDC